MSKENKKQVYKIVHLVGKKHYKEEKKETKKEIKKKEKYIKQVENKECILTNIAENIKSIINNAKDKEKNSYLKEVEKAKNFIAENEKKNEEDNNKNEKKKKEYIEFNYLSEEELDELKEDEDVEVEVVGHFNPDKKFKDKRKHDVLDIDNYAFDVRRRKKGKTVGYVVVKDYFEDIKEENVEEDTNSNEEGQVKEKRKIKVIRYYKRRIYPFFLLLLIICILLGSVWFNRAKIADITGIDLDDVIDWGGDQKKNDSKQITEQTVIPGFVDLVINKSDPYVQLGNPKQNTVYFVYKITDIEKNKIIYQTNGIKPGTAVNWNPYETIKKGTYNLGITIEAYDLETMRACNGANQKMTLVLE